MSTNINSIQNDLRTAKLDGWLFYDFRGRDPIAQNILALPEGMRTRRWYYFVPAKGAPKKLVHKIESESLAALPGETLFYAGQDELRKNLKRTLGGAKMRLVTHLDVDAAGIDRALAAFASFFQKAAAAAD